MWGCHLPWLLLYFVLRQLAISLWHAKWQVPAPLSQIELAPFCSAGHVAAMLISELLGFAELVWEALLGRPLIGCQPCCTEAIRHLT